MKALLWGTPMRKTVSSSAAMLVTIFGIITKGPEAMEAWDGQGLPTVATRGWTRLHTAQLRDIQIDIANGKREQAEATRDRLELDYLKASSDDERVKNKQLQRKQQELIDAYRDQVNAIRAGK